MKGSEGKKERKKECIHVNNHYQRKASPGDLTKEARRMTLFLLVLGCSRGLDVDRNLLHGRQRRHDIDSVCGLGRHGGHLNAFSSVGVITVRTLRLRDRHRLHDSHRRRRRRRRRRSSERAVATRGVHRRRNDRLRMSNRLGDESPVVDNGAPVGPVGPAALAACAEAHTAAGDQDEDDNIEDDVDKDGDKCAKQPEDSLKIFVVLKHIGCLGSLLIATLASVAIIADADVDILVLPAIHTADDDRSNALLKGSILSNTSVQVSDDAGDARPGGGEDEIEVALGLTAEEGVHSRSVQLKGESMVLLSNAVPGVDAAQAQLRLDTVLRGVLGGRVDDLHGECITSGDLDSESRAPVDDSLGELARDKSHRLLHLVAIIAILILVLSLVAAELMRVLVLVLVLMVVLMVGLLVLLCCSESLLKLGITKLAREHEVGLLGKRKSTPLDRLLLGVLVTAERRLAERVCACSCEKQAYNNQNDQLLVHYSQLNLHQQHHHRPHQHYQQH